MRAPRTQNELRCFCARTPLLATYGVNEKGDVYVHVKIFKQHRIFGEVIVTKGNVKIHCRECLRWHKVVMRPPGHAELQETEPNPSAIEVKSTL